ncbi:hypothetical protein ATO67_14185 [Agrobacterium bohemicum]|uniref:Uncharacterized protein n=1 Tax=Agrobacterium bohemicum TaxID=2052828 RepID=A0A135NY89_9HYPH|nr:hypothetical protein ATO67_14185 [Agrobacterium bohemicum]
MQSRSLFNYELVHALGIVVNSMTLRMCGTRHSRLQIFCDGDKSAENGLRQWRARGIRDEQVYEIMCIMQAIH